MTLDFQAALRDVPPDHPSDLALDRLLAGGLADDEAGALHRHCEGCPACAARLATFRRGFDAFEGLDERRLLASLQRAAAAPADAPLGLVERLGAWLRAHLAVVAPVALVAAAAAIFFFRAPPPEPVAPRPAVGPVSPIETVRVKGKAQLHVFRNRDGATTKAISGERFIAGDRLRFQIDLPESGQVTVLGVETDGDLYTAWPLEPGVETQLGAGLKQPLDGAVALDAAPGREVLWLVHCPGATEAPRCTTRGLTGAPRCPATCTLSPFVLNKGD